MYDSSNTYSAFSSTIQGAAALGGAYEQYTALQAQGEYQATMARINQQFANMQAEDVMRQGSALADEVHAKGQKTMGAQRAAAAAQGLDVNDADGSVGAQLNDTRRAVIVDMSTAHNNAWKQAWGIKTQAAIGVSQADFNKSGEDFAANSTLLTGGLKAMGSFAKAGGIYARKVSPDTAGTNDLKMPELGGKFGSGKSVYKDWWQTQTEDDK